MKNKIFVLLGLLVIISAIWYSGCGSDTVTPVIPPGENTGFAQAFTSNDPGNILYDGFNITFLAGAIPLQQNSSPGTVTISVNTSSSVPSGLPALPSGYSQIGKFVTVGPASFIFNTTIRIKLPAGSVSSPTNLGVLTYNDSAQAWRVLQTTFHEDSATQAHFLYVDVLRLGTFVLVNGVTNDFSGSVPSMGGVELSCPLSLDFYVLTVATFTPDPVYPAGYFDNFQPIVGRTFVSPGEPGSPWANDYCRGILPLGSYSFWITHIPWQSPNMVETWSVPVPCTIDHSLNWPLGWHIWGGPAEGWTNLSCTFPPGQWNPGRPPAWPPATIPYGTGTVQATLSWTNTSGSAADLDLHLYGPNNLHIYWQNTTSPNFALDRDWQSQDGNAVENIYSTTTTVPAGDYRVNVAHFAGNPKTFNCRVVVNGSSTNYSGTLGGGSVDVRSFSIH